MVAKLIIQNSDLVSRQRYAFRFARDDLISIEVVVVAAVMLCLDILDYYSCISDGTFFEAYDLAGYSNLTYRMYRLWRRFGSISLDVNLCQVL
jgi:hypothetical protein